MQGQQTAPLAEQTRQSSLTVSFEPFEERAVPGLLRRFVTTSRHLLGLSLGALAARLNHGPLSQRRGMAYPMFRILLLFATYFSNKELLNLRFPVQLRRRLEMLGPTYIKLGQVLSLREDILPKAITGELKNLLDRLPVVNFERYQELIVEGLNRPIHEMFSWISPEPLGSASIAQIHRARTLDGEEVILKVVKPGIRKTLETDAVLIALLGRVLQLLLPQFQPRLVLQEFTDYTLREADLRLEADNAETFAANFNDMDDILFPRIYRDYSSETVLCMEFFNGVKPDSDAAKTLTKEDREHLVHRGAAAIVRMLYQDGFFHADLHPGNLMILPGNKCGFIDLGMVGRFEDGLRQKMMYYYYSLVIGDAVSAARYLTTVARPAPGGQPRDFQRAVEDAARRWHRSANFHDFSIGHLIMNSVTMGAKYRMYFPMEMVLMTKALVTFEGVGNMLVPGFNVAEVSRKEITKVFFNQFHPLSLLKKGLRESPEILEALAKTPMLISQSLKVLEEVTPQQSHHPLKGLGASIFGGFCLMSGSVMLAVNSTLWIHAALLIGMAIVLISRRD
ncbi:ABC1 kinase family protein [Acanthopleuribacter pedis]|uniref:AarF/ABC1/UbiB kinase family protein n=1 Tax=Acanthopleuribacter pedis TaxID=442870 RepID=A0A8J7U3Z0_9BACT|nr:AarF/UbiB family protein [Acanthopleuribacter pedis]MBO1320943.1 AarF/ABC1/UbiB kinase family protein [Acanthopleuribacter pedis]